MRWLTVALCLALAACHADGKASDAKIANGTLTLGDRSVKVPDASEGSVTRDDAGNRLAYPTKDGPARIVYVIGDGLYLGPTVARPVDFTAVPDLEHAFGPLFDGAGPRRGDLVHAVQKARGNAGVVSLLVAAAFVDDPAWEAARKDITGTDLKNLGGMLASGLEPGRSPLQVRRAAETVDLTHPALLKLEAERAKDPLVQGKEPRTAAVLLRATIANDKDAASKIGCDILGGKATSAPLREAAALACTDPAVLAAALAKNGCVPFVRCKDGKPLGWASSTKQDEPLCTSAELAPLLAAELAKPPQSAFDEATGEPELIEYATLAAKGQVPDSFVLAHARRQYKLTQIDKPSCDGVTVGAACHCDEATIRNNACLSPQSATVSVGQCRFQVDDAAKTIDKVVATTPP